MTIPVTLCTFTDHHTYCTYEAVFVSWEEADAFLGRDHRGTPEDDASILKALREAGAPAWIENARGAIDDFGWYRLGPKVAEPLVDSELEELTGDHVVIDEEIYAVETDEQIRAVARLLYRLGLPEQSVYRRDSLPTSRVVVPRS